MSVRLLTANIRTGNPMSKPISPTRYIDDMLSLYAQLGREANDLLDQATTGLAAENPHIPACVLKQRYFTGPAGTMLNVPEALRILRKRVR
jgi:hypothetical protein